jgi:hypothetical protein
VGEKKLNEKPFGLLPLPPAGRSYALTASASPSPPPARGASHDDTATTLCATYKCAGRPATIEWILPAGWPRADPITTTVRFAWLGLDKQTKQTSELAGAEAEAGRAVSSFIHETKATARLPAAN